VSFYIEATLSIIVGFIVNTTKTMRAVVGKITLLWCEITANTADNEL